jgi:hypothetical protein
LQLLGTCHSQKKTRQEIQGLPGSGVLAVTTKNIDLYMEGIPEDFVVRDENGELITRNKQRYHALQDWSIVDASSVIGPGGTVPWSTPHRPGKE